MHANGTARYGAARAPILCAAVTTLLLGATVGGCRSPAVAAFAKARMGDAWRSLSGTEGFSQSNPSVFWDDGPREGYSKRYFVVTSEDGAVRAKAVKEAHGRLTRECWIGAGALDELLQVEQSYPFPAEDVTTPSPAGATTLPSGITLRRWTYAPLRKRRSADDPLLASGVRTSTWATLALILDGWPANSSAEGLSVRLNGKEIPWDDLRTAIRRSQAGGEIRVTER